jgi:hypothetical protein
MELDTLVKVWVHHVWLSDAGTDLRECSEIICRDNALAVPAPAAAWLEDPPCDTRCNHLLTEFRTVVGQPKQLRASDERMQRVGVVDCGEILGQVAFVTSSREEHDRIHLVITPQAQWPGRQVAFCTKQLRAMARKIVPCLRH